MNATYSDILVKRNSIDLSKKGQADAYDLYTRILSAMDKHHISTLETRSDFNLGQLLEALTKAVKLGYEQGFYSKAHNADIKDGNGAWEIKVSPSTYSLCTPLTKAVRVIFITKSGAYTLTKAQVAELLEQDYSDEYIKLADKGVRLKPTVAELGKPLTWLNEVLGF